jgi:hypothetical protein
VSPYRHADEAHLAARRDALIAARRREVAALVAGDSAAARVFRGRFVRAGAGLAGLTMAVLLVDAALTGATPLTPLLDAAWIVVVAAGLAARPLGALALRAGLRRTFAATADLPGDLVLLESTSVERAAAGLADRLEGRSTALPLAALALLLPLTLHRLGAGVLDGLGVRLPFPWPFGAGRPMDAWIQASMLLVGHCHLLLVGLACAFARDLRRHPDLPEEALGERAGWGAFAWTSLASIPAATLCLTLWPREGWLPFILIPTLVTLTGLCFIPLSFAAMGRQIARERRLIRV